jgi:TIR domain
VPAERIFLSYRRDAARHLAGRLADRINAVFGPGAVFMDVDTIVPGADFRHAIVEAVSSCSVLLAVIDPQWLEMKDGIGRRRLNDPEDLVVLEIGTALRRGVMVIPILIDGARMPQAAALPDKIEALVRRNAVRLDHESFTSDSARLLEAIGHALRGSRPGGGYDRQPDQRTVRLPKVAAATAAPGSSPGPAGSPSSAPAIPMHRRALLVVLWCLVFFLTVLTAVGTGANLGPNGTTSIGGSIVVAVILGLGIFGLKVAVDAETRRQQGLLDQSPRGVGAASAARAVSPAMSRVLHISWVSVAALFFVLAWFYPTQR